MHAAEGGAADEALGKWVDWQRYQYRRFMVAPDTSYLTGERVAKLEEMGATSSWNLADARDWVNFFEKAIVHPPQPVEGAANDVVAEDLSVAPRVMAASS